MFNRLMTAATAALVLTAGAAVAQDAFAGAFGSGQAMTEGSGFMTSFADDFASTSTWADANGADFSANAGASSGGFTADFGNANMLTGIEVNANGLADDGRGNPVVASASSEASGFTEGYGTGVVIFQGGSAGANAWGVDERRNAAGADGFAEMNTFGAAVDFGTNYAEAGVQTSSTATVDTTTSGAGQGQP